MIITRITFVLIFCIQSFIQAQVSDFKTIDFSKADNIAKLNEGKGLENLSLLTHQLTAKLPTEVEKFRAIYVWVCNNIKGDNKQHNTVYKFRKKFINDSASYLKWNEDYKKEAFKKLLKHKKTMCTGYAYLIKEMCYLANIESVIVNGYGRSVVSNINNLEVENHSWNAVKLNNKWYLCDATWSSGYINEIGSFVKEYNDGYFLADPILFAKSHYPSEKKWQLVSPVSANEFTAAPLIYGETFRHHILITSPSEMELNKAKKEEITFSFSTTKKIATSRIALVYYVGNKELKCTIYDIKNKDGQVSFKYTFKNKGFYDTHLKIDKDIVASYIVRVNNKV